MSVLPIALIAIAFFVISISAVVIGYKILGGGGTQVAYNAAVDNGDDDFDTPDKKPSPSTKPTGSSTSTTPADNTSITNSPVGSNSATPNFVPSGKQYLAMSETEKRQYLADKAMKIAQFIGNSSSEPIPNGALDKIKGFVDGYAKRVNTKPLGGCRFGDNLQVTYERASKNAHFIVKAFNEKGTDARIGL
jgi:hypothetical protein